jgi:hypothetical protein
MTDLGRVAKAIYGFYAAHPETWPQLEPDEQQHYLGVAKVALQALQEPSTGAMEAFYREMEKGHRPEDFTPVFIRAWQAALQHILDEAK